MCTCRKKKLPPKRPQQPGKRLKPLKPWLGWNASAESNKPLPLPAPRPTPSPLVSSKSRSTCPTPTPSATQPNRSCPWRRSAARTEKGRERASGERVARLLDRLHQRLCHPLVEPLHPLQVTAAGKDFPLVLTTTYRRLGSGFLPACPWTLACTLLGREDNNPLRTLTLSSSLPAGNLPSLPLPSTTSLPALTQT